MHQGPLQTHQDILPPRCRRYEKGHRNFLQQESIVRVVAPEPNENPVLEFKIVNLGDTPLVAAEIKKSFGDARPQAADEAELQRL